MDVKLTHIFRSIPFFFESPAINKWLDLDTASKNRTTLIKPKEVITSWSCQFGAEMCALGCLFLCVHVYVYAVCVSSQLYFFSIFVEKETKTNTNENESGKITCAHFVNMFELLSLGIHACKAYKRTCYILTLSFSSLWLRVFMPYSVHSGHHTQGRAQSALKLNEWTIRSE